MEHVAIDLGGRESQICVRREDGTVLEERRCGNKSLKGYLQKRPKSRVIVETCAEAFKVADEVLAMGHEVRVVPATLVRSLGVGSRGVKNDRRDAQILSEVSCRVDLPSVHIPSEVSRRRKTMTGMREALVESRTKLINCVRGWLRTQGISIRSGGTETFTRRVCQSVKELPPHVERLLTTIDQLKASIEAADQELLEEAQQDATCQRLMTVPGVGSVTAVRFAATLDEVSRFGGAHQVQSYVGLVPGENSSSQRKRLTSITKAGSTQLRWTLVQACWAARRWKPKDPMVLWSREIEKRRGKFVAVIALARKMAGILYALWRDGTTYDPRRGAEATS